MDINPVIQTSFRPGWPFSLTVTIGKKKWTIQRLENCSGWFLTLQDQNFGLDLIGMAGLRILLFRINGQQANDQKKSRST